MSRLTRGGRSDQSGDGISRRSRRRLRRSAPSAAPYSVFHDTIRNRLPAQGREVNQDQYQPGNFSPSRSIVFSGPQAQSYVPKCLSGFNYENVLQGSNFYDDFSRTCWLENHLHMFGRGLHAVSENGDDDVQSNSSSNAPSSLLDLFSEFTLTTTRTNPNHINNVNNMNINNVNNMNVNNVNNNINVNNLNTINSNSQSSLSSDSLSQDIISTSDGGTVSTVSEITQFYQRMNLDGFSFDYSQLQQGVMLEPPPYSEDPPPPYTEEIHGESSIIRGSVSNLSESGTSDSGSAQRIGQAIIW